MWVRGNTGGSRQPGIENNANGPNGVRYGQRSTNVYRVRVLLTHVRLHHGLMYYRAAPLIARPPFVLVDNYSHPVCV